VIERRLVEFSLIVPTADGAAPGDRMTNARSWMDRFWSGYTAAGTGH
jgi:hypothetical protein